LLYVSKRQDVSVQLDFLALNRRL